MDEATTCWWLMAVVFFYMFCTKQPRLRLQHYIGRFQWYYVAAIVLDLFVLETVWDFIKHECIGLEFLGNTKKIAENLATKLPNATLVKGVASVALTPEKKMDYELWPTLRWLALVAPAFGVLAMALLTFNMLSYTSSRRSSRKKAAKSAEENRVQLGSKSISSIYFGMRVQLCGQRNGEFGTIVSFFEHDQYTINVESKGCCGKFDQINEAPENIRFVYDKQNFWEADIKDDATVCLILLPGVFILMAIRAELRVLELSTGSVIKSRALEKFDWDERALWLLSTYTADLEVAMAFQFVTVVAFGLLCCSYFGITESVSDLRKNVNTIFNIYGERSSDRGEEDQTIMDAFRNAKEKLHSIAEQSSFQLTWAGMQGIWAYCVLGVIRCLLAILIQVLRQQHLKFYHDYFQNTVANNLSIVFSFFTFVCIGNMAILLKMPELTKPEAMGKRASLKFLACRGLLLISQMQAMVLKFIGKYLLPNLGENRSLLCNACLLTVECFFIAIWNIFAWQAHRDTDNTDEDNSLGKPLVDQ